MKFMGILIGVMLIASAVALGLFLDVGYHPDSYDCGSSALTGWYGVCGDGSGEFLHFLKFIAVVVLGSLGVFKVILATTPEVMTVIIAHTPEKEEENSPQT